MIWKQNLLILDQKPRGFHLITWDVLSAIPELGEIAVGFLQVFIQHTSASLCINENADPDVRTDMETAMNLICPESMPFEHTCEGPDDMPAHVKAALLGSQLLIPIVDGRLAVGSWQGIYLCEHRNHGGRRKLILTAMGQRFQPDRNAPEI